MIHIANDDHKKAIKLISQSRNGQLLIDALRARKQELIDTWLRDLDPAKAAHIRGKASELNELIELFVTLSQSKE